MCVILTWRGADSSGPFPLCIQFCWAVLLVVPSRLGCQVYLVLVSTHASVFVAHQRPRELDNMFDEQVSVSKMTRFCCNTCGGLCLGLRSARLNPSVTEI